MKTMNNRRIYITPSDYEIIRKNPKSFFVEAKGEPILELKVVGGLRRGRRAKLDLISDGVSEEIKLDILKAFSEGEKENDQT